MNTTNEYISLSGSQIIALESQGNRCADWSLVRIHKDLATDTIRNVRFSGKVTIGLQSKAWSGGGSAALNCGIYNSSINNCTIGNNVFINNNRGIISDYDIESDVAIEGCGSVSMRGISSFGNGIDISVINEAGGREVRMWDRLSAPAAFLISMHRHNSALIEKYNNLISDYSKSVSSARGFIGSGSRIKECVTIENVKIGPSSIITGALYLENGSVNSTAEAPVEIGYGVIMKQFIVSPGAMVTDSANIEKCFVGEGTVISKRFTAINSLFFANSEMLNGEACSLFAGPYTVSHHKSTLLIAGLFSFMNAGSGSNQSNHMYRLGPVHQGIVGRGSKLASDSYILWPASIGAFTLVSGRHYSNADTSDFPFSYLVEENDETHLIPAVNLKNAGTFRDIAKWPRRDRRNSTAPIDPVMFNVHSPCTMGRVLSGIRRLEHLKRDKSTGGLYYLSDDLKIPAKALEKGLELYDLALAKYTGSVLVRRLKGFKGNTDRELREFLKPADNNGVGEWTDCGGLLLSVTRLNGIADAIATGKVQSPAELNNLFKEAYDNYPEDEWSWVAGYLETALELEMKEIKAADIAVIVEKWAESIEAIDAMILADGMKEFSKRMMTGYGFGLSAEEKPLDFAGVRGVPEENGFIRELKSHTEAKKREASDILSALKKLT